MRNTSKQRGKTEEVFAIQGWFTQEKCGGERNINAKNSDPPA